MTRTCVLLADDHTLVRAGIKRLLEEDPDLEVVGEADDGYAVLEQLEEKSVDVAILDIAMPRLNGLDTARQLKKHSPETKVVLLSMYDYRRFIREALRAGVDGYVLKREVADTLISAIHRVREGQYAFSTPVLRGIVDSARQGVQAQETSLDALTDRERQVLQLVAEGYSNKEIARLLELSPETVRNHRASVMKKLDMHGVVELVRYAVEQGLIVPGRASAAPEQE